jgi:hypothetical protein
MIMAGENITSIMDTMGITNMMMKMMIKHWAGISMKGTKYLSKNLH